MEKNFFSEFRFHQERNEAGQSPHQPLFGEIGCDKANGPPFIPIRNLIITQKGLKAPSDGK